MNILFVGGGRRVSLGNLFIEAGHKIYSYETSKIVPISWIAEIILGKKWKDPLIQDHLLETIEKYDIDLVIPLMDEGVTICSNLKSKIPRNIFPSPNFFGANICLNKIEFEDFILKNYPRYYPTDDNSFPKIIKPIYGFGSKGIHKIHNSDEELIYYKKDSYVKQKFIEGEEFSVDAYFNKEGKMIDASIRKRLRVFDGEVISSETLFNLDLYNITKEIGENLNLMGPTCFQYIIDSNKIYIIEINARFGGGVILSIKSGLNMIKYFESEYLEMNSVFEIYSKKILRMERYFNETFFEI